jgi:hypothetical protein
MGQIFQTASIIDNCQLASIREISINVPKPPAETLSYPYPSIEAKDRPGSRAPPHQSTPLSNRLSSKDHSACPPTHVHSHLMFSRFSQLTRHLIRPLPNYAHNSAARFARTAGIMTSSTADERNSRTIHTAACLIIGDEVLGGKVCYALCCV